MHTATRILGCFLATLICSVSLQATTIIPFANLGDMALAADAVVVVRAGETRLEEKGNGLCRRTPFLVTDVIKGDLQPGENVDLDSWWRRQGDRETTIWGDPTYESGTTYLIFLSKLDHAPYWQPMMLAYGQFYLRTINGVDFFFPSNESKEIHAFPRPDGIVPETMKVMLAKELIQHLRNVVTGKTPWQEKLILPEGEVKELKVDMRVAPSHCTFLSYSGTPFRYEDISTNGLLVFSQEGGDPSLSPATLAYTYVEDAVDEIILKYEGVNISYGNELGFTPDCLDNSAYYTNFDDTVDLYQSLVIFDDPCEEITNLSINGSNQCSGVLAVGGLWAGGTHMFDGLTWYNGQKSYVVVNNQLGVCTNIDYTIVLIHELTHGLGIGHIAGNNTANMNPNCCKAIQQLDIDCLDYTYPPAPLPVELTTFTATRQMEDVQLSWSTATEINNDFFRVQRSFDGSRFQELATRSGHGTTSQPQQYSFLDRNPGAGQWYYRLEQIDLDGKSSFSPLVTVQLDGETSASHVYPNPLSGQTIQLQRQADRDGDIQVHILALDQTVLLHQTIYQHQGGNQWELSLPDLQPGIYFLRLMDDQRSEVIRFCVTR